MEEEGNLSQLRMQELRQKCEELGLSHEGLNRNQLIKNIEEAKEEQASPLPSAPVMSTDKTTTQNTAARTESDTMEEARMQFELEKMRMQVRLAELENAKLEIERKGTNAGSFGLDGGIRRMPMYKEGEDVDVFLRAFEKMAQLNEWPREVWALQLAPLLAGRAREAYSRLSLESSRVYDEVKLAILRRYDLTPEAYRVKFRELKVDRDETYTEFSVKLTDLLGRWLQGAGALNDLDRLKEEILKEQMLKQVSFDLRVWLRDHEPDTLGDMARLADQYVISRKGAGKPQGHWGKAGPNHSPKPGWNSGSGGGKGESKPNPQQNKKQNEDRGNYRAKVRCYTCDKFGHIAVNCPNAHKSEVQAEKKGNDKSKEHGPTYFCRPEPHPKLRPYISDARLGDRHVRLLRDSGCTHSLARSDVVDPTFIIPGETVKMRGLFSKKEVPIARVHLISEPYGIKKWIRVGLVDEIEVDVLLGNEVLDENDPDLDIPDYVSRKEASLVVTRNQAREKELKEEQTRAEVIRSKVQVRDLFGENEQGEAADSGNDDDEREDGAHEVNDENDVHDDDTTVGTGESDTTSDKAANGEEPQGEKILPTYLDIGRKELIQAQQDDPSLKSVWEKVEKKEGNEGRCHFYVENGVLMREWSGNSKSESREVYTQIVVPKGYRTRLLEVAHDNLTAGHLGVGKTQQRLMQNFYWPGIFRDVAEFCKTCGPCQKCASQTRGISRAKLVSVPVIGSPFRKIALDIVGPLPRSKKGNRYILVVCDYATRYPEAVPLPSIEAERVADELIRIFSRVGIPHELLSDQGSNFMSLLMKQLCSSLGIKQIRTSPYHPQANGLVERFNATLKDMLKPYTLEGNVTWDDLIPYVLFAYREVPQESTGFSPFELLYGHRVRGPLDVIREAWLGETVPEEGLVSYVLNCRERLANITTAAQKNLAQAQKRQKAWYDRKARTKDLQVGDKVLVLLPSSSNKLLAKWQGPYPVIQKLSDVNYVVEMGDKRKKHRVFHTNMLRVWREREECVMYTDVDDGNDDEYLDQFIEPLTQRGTSSEVELPDYLTTQQTQQLGDVIHDFTDILSDNPGRTDRIEHDLVTSNDHPIRQKAYRLPHAVRETVKRELDEMLEAGVISHSDSPYASPLVIVKKKDGSLRLCVDYRKLNQVTEFDAYPMPNIEAIIDELGKAKFMTTIDLTKGYWQVPLTKEARKKSAFITPFGLFEFNVMPFGMQGAPATFQRLVDQVLRGVNEFATAYIDDIIIYSESWDEHLAHVREVLGRLRAAGLTAKPSKCKFARKEVLYLGFVLGEGCVKPEPAKIDAVVNFPQPVTKTDVRAFLGLTGYYRKFIPNYSKVAAPLSDLTRKNEPRLVRWNSKCSEALEVLKHALVKSPVLRNPDFEKEFIVQVDASDRGIGAVLSQKDEKVEEHPIAYISKKLLPREQRYATIEKECLAIVWAIQKFQPYLFGRKFLVQTDHNPLRWLHQMQNHNARLMRWCLQLQAYPMRVEHRSGAKNGNADGLSRM
ncbi:uncharacterized protein [Diadema setosum]|uniref:uncharacterized protein n=1 Tax=Diadema setosum TaxID=31175 RepID=UPI003B3B38E8